MLETLIINLPVCFWPQNPHPAPTTSPSSLTPSPFGTGKGWRVEKAKNPNGAKFGLGIREVITINIIRQSAGSSKELNILNKILRDNTQEVYLD